MNRSFETFADLPEAGSEPPPRSALSQRLGRLRLAVLFARRELRTGTRGFRVFIACIALGVATIAGVGSLARGLTDSLDLQSRALLGGDLEMSRVHRPLQPDEQSAFGKLGPTSSVATFRAMARNPASGDQTLAEVKAVDGPYPLVGTLEVEGGGDPHGLLAEHDGRWGVLADPALAARLGLKVGDTIAVGTLEARLTGLIAREPDRLASGFELGPRLMLDARALPATGLIGPGSLVTWRTRVLLGEPAPPDAAVTARKTALDAAFPDAGWRLRGRSEAATGFADNIRRFAQYLTVVGLSALAVGGVGVANAVAAFVARKRATIGMLRSLGASGLFVFAVALIQVVAIAAVGIVIGLAIGALVPPIAGALLAAKLPVGGLGQVFPGALALAALYGLLTALVFSLWPLGRVHDVSPSVLVRDRIGADAGGRPRRAYWVATGLAALALAGLAIGLAEDRRLAAVFVVGLAGSFLLLRLVAWALGSIARRVRPRRAEIRLALAEIGRPGALTGTVVLSLGLGLTLLVALAGIDRNLRDELAGRLPATAPSFFFLDVPRADLDGFKAFLAKEAPGATVTSVPMLRGRLIALKGIPVADYKVPKNVEWVLSSDRGITFAAEKPEHSTITAGTWWPADVSGPPQVSFAADIARDLGLKVGDSVKVNVLGRTLEARIANLRTVDWDNLGINFVMVFSPNTFAGAPYSELATLSFPDGGKAEEEVRLMRDLGRAFPTVTAVRVKETLETIDGLVDQLALAIRATAGIALTASILVLAGALAASHESRIYDAVILKTLGATRWRLLAIYGLEYLILALATGLFAVAAGSAAAYAVVAGIMKIPFHLSLASAAGFTLLAVALTVGFGLVGTWRALGHRPAGVLRTL